MLFQLESSIVSVRVFCCFSLGLLLFQSESSVCPPDGKVGIRVTEKFRFLRFTFKFQPKDNSIQSLLNLLHLNGLEPHLSPLSSQKMKCSFLDYIQLLFISWTGRWTWTPYATPLQQKNEMLIFGLCSTSDDRPGWSMDSNPICHPSPAKNMKFSFLDYVQLQLIGRAVWWTQNPSATLLQPKKWNAHFWITFNFWWSAWLVDGLEPHLLPLSSQKYEMLIFGLHSCSDDRPGWSMDSNPICHPSPAKNMKCSFLDYIHILMIGWASQWTQTPSATPLQPKKWNAHFWIMFNFWWSARHVVGLEPHLPLLSSQKMKCSFFDYIQLLMISWAGRWTRTP